MESGFKKYLPPTNSWFPTRRGGGSFRVDQVCESHLGFCLGAKGAFPKGVIFRGLHELFQAHGAPLAFLRVALVQPPSLFRSKGSTACRPRACLFCPAVRWSPPLASLRGAALASGLGPPQTHVSLNSAITSGSSKSVSHCGPQRLGAVDTETTNFPKEGIPTCRQQPLHG